MRSPNFFLIAALLGLGCGPSAGTKTHWLKKCDINADCDGKSECICAVCTQPCESDDDCDGGICPSLISKTGLCGDASRGRVCLPSGVRECSVGLTSTKNMSEFLGALGSGGSGGPTEVSDCDVEDALLCEDFEEQFSATHRVAAVGAEVGLQSCLRANGQGALSYFGEEDEGYAFVELALAERVASGPLSARFHAYVPSAQKLSSLTRVFSFRSVPEFTGEEIGIHFTGGREIRLSTAGPSKDSEKDVFPLDEWFCVEMNLDVAPNGSAEVLVNGKSVLSAEGIESRPASGPIGLGVIYGTVFGPDPVLELAIDDLVVATSSIGCL